MKKAKMKMKQITKKMKYLNYLTKWSKPNNKQKRNVILI